MTLIASNDSRVIKNSSIGLARLDALPRHGFEHASFHLGGVVLTTKEGRLSFSGMATAPEPVLAQAFDPPMLVKVAGFYDHLFFDGLRQTRCRFGLKNDGFDFAQQLAGSRCHLT
ncbi:hypothetical protein D3C72_880750 [compost metagenome]